MGWYIFVVYSKRVFESLLTTTFTLEKQRNEKRMDVLWIDDTLETFITNKSDHLRQKLLVGAK